MLKNALNKSHCELNFLLEAQWKHMSISPRSRVRGLQRLPCFKYYAVLKWKSRFTLGSSKLDDAKITNYIKKCFK